MPRIAGIVAAAVLALASTAQAMPTVRFHLKPGRTLAGALRYYDTGLNRQASIAGASCRMTDGTASTGWLHIACQGRTESRPFVLTYTPVTCKTLGVRLVIIGVAHTDRHVGWAKDAPFTCG